MMSQSFSTVSVNDVTWAHELSRTKNGRTCFPGERASLISAAAGLTTARRSETKSLSRLQQWGLNAALFTHAAVTPPVLRTATTTRPSDQLRPRQSNPPSSLPGAGSSWLSDPQRITASYNLIRTSIQQSNVSSFYWKLQKRDSN